jgi:hypothetical protein
MSFHGRAPHRMQQMNIADPWSESYKQINRETAPSTAGNAPVNDNRYSAYVPEDYQVPADMPPPGANLSPQEMAQHLIASKMARNAAIIGGSVIGAGALGMAANSMQGDSNGNLLQNPITQAALLSGAGAGIGYGAVDFHQGRNLIQSPQGSYAHREMTANRARHRGYGAIGGTAAGLLAGLTTQLNDINQTSQY